MAKKYEMKDLGYPRTPCDARVRVTFSNGERWELPAQVVVDDRDANYQDELENTYGYILTGSLDGHAITRWLSGNMNWCEVDEYATRVADPTPVDYDRDFLNARKELVK